MLKAHFWFIKNNEKTVFITEEINGSKVEKRTCKIMTDMTHITRNEDWKNLQTIIKIESTTYHKSKNKETKDKRYYISSQLNTPEIFLKHTRNHWLIENKLHWSLDVILKEDESRKRNNNIAENFSIILKLVLKLLQEKQLKNKKISIKRMRKMAAWNLDYLIEMLNF